MEGDGEPMASRRASDVLVIGNGSLNKVEGGLSVTDATDRPFAAVNEPDNAQEESADTDPPRQGSKPDQVTAGTPVSPLDSPAQNKKTAPTEEEVDSCRICRSEGTPDQPLFYPCKCSGSIKYVHQECLMEWLSHTQKKYCELCKTPFTFTKLYDGSMPQTLPLPLFIGQLLLLGFNTILRWSRFTMVTFVWLIWLPWSIRQVWRGLFWLADGSWVAPDGTELHGLIENGTSVVLTAIASATPTTSSIAAEVTNAMPQEGGPIAAFLSFTTSELLVVKLLRLVYPNVYQILKAVFSDGAFPEPDLNRQRRSRLPSLLSDVTYFKTLTSYTVLNNAIMDVLEGQLICLLIVTAFILVFLIREWVINQQPAAAMPDPDRPDAPLAPLQQDQQHGAEGARQVNRRRRRGFRVVPEQRERVQVAARQAEMQEVNPIPAHGQQGREAIAAPTNPPASVTPRLSRSGTEKERSQSTGASRLRSEESNSNHFKAADLSSRDPLSPSQEQRPTLQAVHGLDETVDIRRRIEESSAELTTPTSRSQFLPSKHPKAVMNAREASGADQSDEIGPLRTSSSPEQEQSRIGTKQASFAEHLAQRLDRAAESEDVSENLPIEHTRTLEDETSSLVEDGGPAFNPQDGLAESNLAELDGIASVPLTPSTEGEQPVDTPTTSEDDGPGEAETGPAPRPETLFGRVANWMWHTDGPVPEVVEHHDDDDVHVVHDIDAEAPFVPVAPHPGLHEPVHDPARGNADAPDGAEPPAAPADNVFGVDPNDPNAIEEAEDLDGILELIGMRGPIINMIQNVIFSEVLITLTIAASVWLPYIWGKITLLIIANPIDVYIKAPLHIISRVADAIVDIMLFIAGSLLHAVDMAVNWLVKAAVGLLPDLISGMDTSKYGAIALKMANGSQARLQKSVAITLSGLRPDLPTFSILSHRALRNLEDQLSEQTRSILGSMTSVYERTPAYFEQIASGNIKPLMDAAKNTSGILEHISGQAILAVKFIVRTARTMSIDLSPTSSEGELVLDVSLVRWDTRDKIIAIVLGYAFLSCTGYAYLKISRLVSGTRAGDKAEGIIADSLRQAGGVAKVILIIGIEMIAFPLYCGLLLDFALMPLFPGVTFQSRCAFIVDAPTTALFVHWFIGTCYMFHFALFVSMCRKVMRKGVLYFIRDPDDPTFHPVRDVLERPVAGQLSKIAFSAIVYGGLVMACLGGVIWVLTCIDGVLPINWLGNEPKLELPVDVLFYNFLLPFLIRKVEPSTKIAAMWEWWFRGCARNLRLTHFMFDEVKDDERGTWKGIKWNPWTERREGPQYFHRDGTFVRAPASDSVRIPKGERVFLEVNENNERAEGEEVNEDGPHGRRNKNFTKIYIPPDFRARIAAFIFLIWLFAATTGILFTIGPMMVGRKAIRILTQIDEPANDLYAFTVGVHICGALAYAAAYAPMAKQWIMKKAAAITNDQSHLVKRVYSAVTYILGLAYLLAAFGIILPFLFSMVSELYILLPLYTYLTSAESASSQSSGSATATSIMLQHGSSTTIHVLQTWTLGLLYLRLVLRLAMGYPCQHTRCAAAMRSILRNGILHPDVKLATRAFILPAFTVSTILLLAPLAWGWSINTVFDVQQAELRIKVFRYAYPGLMAIVLAGYCAHCLKRQIGLWRVKIRDEVYLIGERLHNYGDKGKQRATIERTAAGSQRMEVMD